MSNEATIEQAIQAKGLTAPRLTPDSIQAVIREEHYFTAGAALDAVRFGWLIADHQNANERQAARDVAERLGVMGEGAARHAVDVSMGRDGNGWSQSLDLLTICVLVLKNGFTVIGKSACASPENFDAEIGRKVARADAINQVWPLEGYLLKQMLHEAAVKASSAPSGLQPHQQRVVAERAELDERLEKLVKFFATDTFASLDREEQNRLTFQAATMTDYSSVLKERIEAFTA